MLSVFQMTKIINLFAQKVDYLYTFRYSLMDLKSAVMKYKYLSALLIILALFPAASFASPPKFNAHISRDGKRVDISFQAPTGQSCTSNLFVSKKSKKPKNISASDVNEVSAFSIFKIHVTGLGRIARHRSPSVPIYFRATMRCGDKRYEKVFKADLNTAPKKASFKSSALWIKALREKLTDFLNQQNEPPTPTPTFGPSPTVTPTPTPTLTPTPTRTPGDVHLVEAFPNLTFAKPLDFRDANDGLNRLFVAELKGKIYSFAKDPNTSTKNLFLDISTLIPQDAGATEQGILGFVFHPQFATNGYFYVQYNRVGDEAVVISRFQASPDLSSADVSSETVLLVSPPIPGYADHNGGSLQFGPNDGYLYITRGDGDQGTDPNHTAQDLTLLLGKVLRIDVDHTDIGLNYAIPPSNPYANNALGYRKEIFAHGFRNPWRASFDAETGFYWVGDVGQDDREEVDIVTSGGNYGWNVMEGTMCFDPPVGCDQNGITLPVAEYDHSLGSAVTGGFVYHGNAVPQLRGSYIYGDFGSGRIWTLTDNGGGSFSNADLMDTTVLISSFGQDSSGEVYIVGYGSNGKIYKFE